MPLLSSHSPIKQARLELPNQQGEQLAALINRPPGKAKAWVLFAHCFTCSKQIGAATRISHTLTRQGFAVLRFDFTGLGNSEGDFANTNFTTHIADLVAAADYLRSHHQAPSILIGHSLGGAAVLMAAAEIEEVKAVVSIGAPSTPEHVQHLFAPALDEIRQNGQAEVTVAGRPFLIKQQMLDDFARHQTLETIAQLRRPLLLMHSPLDSVVEIDQAREIFQAAKHPKSFISLDQADHMLSNPVDADYAANTIAAWVARYIGDKPEPVTPAPTLKPGHVWVREHSHKPYQNEVITPRHRLFVDEPVHEGGSDTGPKPNELLLAALSGCISITLRMYAEHKDLPVDTIQVQASREANNKDNIPVIRVRVKVTGDLDAAQNKRIMAVAKRCPVHKLLTGDLDIQHELENS